MRRFTTIVALSVAPLLLASCELLEGLPGVPGAEEAPPPTTEEQPAEPSLLREEDLVTRNVTYTGILEDGGMTIYQQGTHRLMLSDGRMVLLELAEGSFEFRGDQTLDNYVGKLVRVHGDVSPTVEAGGTLMKVLEIGWIRRETDENGEEKEVVRVLCGGGTTCPAGFVCKLAEEGPGVCMEGEEGEEGEEEVGMSEEDEELEESGETGETGETEGAEEVGEVGESSDGTVEEEVGETEEMEEAPSEASATPEVSEALALMLEEDYAAERWTQVFCFKQLNVCVDGHMNWYFKSFGAMSTVLGHAEIGPLAVNDVGDGPIVVDLKTGDLAALGVADGDIKEVGNEVIGYRAWTDPLAGSEQSRHFEISGDARLREPVRMVTKSLRKEENITEAKPR